LVQIQSADNSQAPAKPCSSNDFQSCDFSGTYGNATHESQAQQDLGHTGAILGLWAAGLAALALLLAQITVSQPWLVFTLRYGHHDTTQHGSGSDSPGRGICAGGNEHSDGRQSKRLVQRSDRHSRGLEYWVRCVRRIHAKGTIECGGQHCWKLHRFRPLRQDIRGWYRSSGIRPILLRK